MNYKYKTTFNSTIFAANKVADFQRHRKESLASLKSLMPHTDGKDIDLLAVAFDGAVINSFNKNDDGIGSETAVRALRSFRHRPINIEHDRSRIIGHITDAAFTNRDNHEIIWAEDAARIITPYNLSLGGFVYKMVDADFYQDLEQSMDEGSSRYKSISASWEIGFNTFGIAVGSQELQYCQVVSNPIHVAELAPFLRCFGGQGITDKGEKVYRLIMGEVYPLGMGFVENPAADVKGIEGSFENEKEEENEKSAAKKTVFMPNKEGDISQKEKNDVKTHDLKNSMDLLEQLKQALANQDKITQEVAANLGAQFAEMIRKSDEQYREQIAQKEQAIAQEKEKQDKLVRDVAAIKEELEQAKKEIEEFQKKEQQEAVASALNQRMENLDSLYDFDNEDRKVVIEDLAKIDVTSDEAFEAFASKVAVIFRHKNKEFIAAEAAKREEAVAKAVAEALAKNGTQTSTASEKQEGEGLDGVQPEGSATIPNNNGGQAEELSLAEKMSKAFNKESVKVTL